MNQIAVIFNFFFSWSLPPNVMSLSYITGMGNTWHTCCVSPLSHPWQTLLINHSALSHRVCGPESFLTQGRHNQALTGGPQVKPICCDSRKRVETEECQNVLRPGKSRLAFKRRCPAPPSPWAEIRHSQTSQVNTPQSRVKNSPCQVRQHFPCLCRWSHS